MSEHNTNAQGNEDDPPIDSRIMDALLGEILGGAKPPDLSQEIFRQLRETPLVSPPPSVGSRDVVVASRQRSSHSWLTVISLLAASLLCAIGYWKWQQSAQPRLAPIAKTPQPVEKPALPSPPSVTPQPSQRERIAPAPRGIAISKQPSESEVSTASETYPFAKKQGDVSPVQLVSQRVSEGLNGYWKAIGVTPSPQATAEDAIQRIQLRLGIALDPAWFESTSRESSLRTAGVFTAEIEASLKSPVHSQAIAKAWLKQLTGGGLSRLPEEEAQALIEDLSCSFEGQYSFDTLISGWVGAERPTSPAWYAAMNSGGEFAMTHRLASLTMNVDLRCTRCHDALIDSSGRQSDYWSFVSVLRRDVRRGDDGSLYVRKSDEPTSPSRVFYERLDGRQTFAEPGIPGRWMSQGSALLDIDSNMPQPTGVDVWSKSLVGSRELAKGVVNSLWRLVYDRALQGEVADASSPPLDDSLSQLHNQLVDDLLASNFDLSRTLAIILSSPAALRSIPDPLLQKDAWAVDAARVREAESAVQAFAAAAPSPKSLPTSKRVELAMRSIGASLKSLEGFGPVLAQPLGSERSEPDTTISKSTPHQTGFPDHAESLPVQWLSTIDDFHSRVRHLGYLAEIERLPTVVEPAAEAMRKANVADELILARVWWMLQP